MAIKLFFFDMDGTIYNKLEGERKVGDHGQNMYALIYATLGPQAQQEDLEGIRLFDEGTYSYIEWCEHTMKVYKKYGLTKKVFTRLMERFEFNPYVTEVVSELHRKGIRTAIVSGGITELARRAQQKLSIHHAYASTEFIWDEEGNLEHWNILPSDYEAKVDFVESLRKESKLAKEECAFVGDGHNDVDIAKHVGTSFAYKAHPELQKVATHTIEDFRDILKYV